MIFFDRKELTFVVNPITLSRFGVIWYNPCKDLLIVGEAAHLKAVEIKRAIRDFSQIANDYLHSHYDSHHNNLHRFFMFAYGNEVIKQIIEPLMKMQVDLDNIFITSNGFWIRNVNLPVDKNERIAVVLQLMDMERKKEISFENISLRMNPREKNLPRLLAIFNRDIIAPVIRDLFVKLNDFIEDELEQKDEVPNSVLNIFYGSIIAEQGANVAIGQSITQTKNIQHDQNQSLPFKFLEGEKMEQATNNGRKIFISHSSDDKLIVEPLIDLLEGLGLKSDMIFCSSFEGYKIPYGEDFLNYIKRELSENTIVLFMLSENFYSSYICMCEMGATWIKSARNFPILIPPLTYDKMKGVISSQTQSLVINNSRELDGFITQLFKELNLSVNLEIWNRKKEKFLESINQLLNKTSINEPLTSTNENEQKSNNLQPRTYLELVKKNNTYLQILNKDKGLDWLNGALRKMPSKINFMTNYPTRFESMPTHGDTFFIAIYNDNNDLVSRLYGIVEGCTSRKPISEIIYEADSGKVDYGFSSLAEFESYIKKQKHQSDEVFCVTLRDIKYNDFIIVEGLSKFSELKYSLHILNQGLDTIIVNNRIVFDDFDKLLYHRSKTEQVTMRKMDLF